MTPRFSVGIIELALMFVALATVAVVLYFAWWRPRRRTPPGFDVTPVATPDRRDPTA